MIDILDTNSLRKKVADELAVSYSVTLLSAYITVVGVDWLLSVIPKNAELTIVGRFSPRDLKSGASDIAAIRTLLDHGYTVKALSSLHAKIIAIDNETIFLGSANYTGRGLGLVDECNLEASVRLQLSPASKDFISSIVKYAFNIDFNILNKLEDYLSGLDIVFNDVKELEWPLTVFKKIESLFVKDFPFAPIGVYSELYTDFPGSDYFQIYLERNNELLSKHLFKNSDSYIWIIQLLSKDECRDGLSFGRLSSYIHDMLADDPAPYRKTVKDLQSNFYSYLKKYSSDVIEFYKPGTHSEFIKLR